MNKMQKAYIAAKKDLEDAENLISGMEKVFLANRGRNEERLFQIDDDRAFNSLMIEFYEAPEIVAIEEDIHAKRDVLKKAEKDLIEYALGISPAGVRDTLRKGAETQITIRQKLIDLVMRLDTKTVSVRR